MTTEQPTVLKPREWNVIRAAIYSQREFGIESYLCSPGQTKAAERMIARGFLTKVEQIGFGGWGLVIKITAENVEAINAAFDDEAAYRRWADDGGRVLEAPT
jgi:hypothetical protein